MDDSGETIDTNTDRELVDLLRQRVDELETRLIEQEHHGLQWLWNLWRYRSPRSTDERASRRQRAAFRAFSWGLMSFGARAGVTIAAFVGIFLAWKANTLFDQQSRLFTEQNQWLQEQIAQEKLEDSRTQRARLLSVLFDDTDSSPTTRRDALSALVLMGKERENGSVAKVTDFSKQDLPTIQLQATYLEGHDFSDANLARADLSEANLRGANLTRAKLSGADLSGTALDRANLSGAKLMGADLNGAALTGAVLVEANLGNADLSRADFSDANLSRAVLSNCKYDDETSWPADFKPPVSCENTSEQPSLEPDPEPALVPPTPPPAVAGGQQ